jgi:hypothetical protein
MQSPPLCRLNNKNSQAPGFSTPQSSPDHETQGTTDSKQLKYSTSKSVRVQFGVAQAAEYDLDAPAAKFTPLPAEVAQRRFPLTGKKKGEDGEEEIAETKENSALLAAWEEDFDNLLEDDDDCSVKPRRRHSSRRQRSDNTKQRRSNRFNRRKSSSFLPPKDGQPLYIPGIDVVDDRTPEDPSLIARDNVTCLTVESPSAGLYGSEHKQQNNEDDDISVSPSPVLARRLSQEPLTTRSNEESALEYRNNIVSQEEEPDLETNSASNIKGSPLALHTSKVLADSINFWDAAVTDFMVLTSEDSTWDLKTIATNLALSSFDVYNPPITADPDCDNETIAISSAWHSCLNGTVCTAIDAMLQNRKLSTKTDTYDYDDSLIEPDWQEAWRHVAQQGWKKLELEFLENLALEFVQAKQRVTTTALVLDSVVLPVKVSVEPTKQQLADTEEDIRRLEDLIRIEEESKNRMQQRYKRAQLQRDRLKATGSLLAYHAIGHLSPVEVSISQYQHQAVFSHVMEGMETRLDLGESMNISLSQKLHCKRNQGSDMIANFYSGMLCPSPEKLQQGLLQLLSASMFDTTEFLSEMAVLAGRIDLAALSLQQVAFERDISVCLEGGSGSEPVLVVRIEFAQETTLKVFYGRNKFRSAYWSLPSSAYVEQGGTEIQDLNATLSQWLNCRSLKGTAGFLLAACKEVMARVGGCPPATPENTSRIS